MTATATFWVAAAGLAVTCLAALGARSLAQFSPHELKEICRRRNHPDRLGQILKRRDQVGLAAETLQVMATAVFVGAATFWVWSDWARPGAGAAAFDLGHGGRGTLAAGRGNLAPLGRGPAVGRSLPLLYLARLAKSRLHAWRRWGWPPASSMPSSIASPADRPRNPTKIRSTRRSAPSSPKATARDCSKKTPAK